MYGCGWKDESVHGEQVLPTMRKGPLEEARDALEELKKQPRTQHADCRVTGF